MRRKNLGFTLAEVLIVIGIIGVVAALTLPNLNHATGDKEKVTKVKKVYSSLADAFGRAEATYGPVDTWFKGIGSYDGAGNERIAKRVTEFMKVSKDCGFEAGCFSTAPYLLVNGDEQAEDLLDMMQNDTTPQYMVMLSDGMSLAFYQSNSMVKIRADIDGPDKGKNQDGNDLFYFSLSYDDNDYGQKADLLCPSLYPNLWTDNNIQYATAWVIENGNLDYLKCADELNWETKTSCE